MKLKPRSIVITILLVTALFILLRAVFDAYLKLDQEWKDLVTVIGFSVFGLFLIFVRRIPKVNHYLIESMEVLILGIVPTIASFRLVAVSDLGKYSLGGMIVCIDMIWFVYYISIGRKRATEDEFKQAKWIIIVVFFEILGMGLLTYGFVSIVLHPN
ncbi:MAG: hypothetical protein WAN47_02415 [Nitrosotalea sp.]